MCPARSELDWRYWHYPVVFKMSSTSHPAGGADVEFETRSFPNLLVATLATYVDHSHGPVLAPATLAALPSTRAIPDRDVFYVADPSAPFAPSVFSALAENSLFSMRRFVALLELGELLLRAGDVRLVRATELKELPLPTKV
jgi:hypothetical protein